MGLRGRKPTPTAILKARGNPAADRRAQYEPEMPEGDPVCPAHLSDAAKAEWPRLLALLKVPGLAKPVDADCLALYCAAYARWAAAELELAANGTVVKSPSGYPIQNPYLSVANAAMKQMAGILARFGMSPADRARVNTPPPAAKREEPKRTFPRLRIAK